MLYTITLINVGEKPLDLKQKEKYVIGIIHYDQVRFISEQQEWFNVGKCISIVD